MTRYSRIGLLPQIGPFALGLVLLSACGENSTAKSETNDAAGTTSTTGGSTGAGGSDAGAGGSDSAGGSAGTAGSPSTDDCDIIVDDADCDTSLRPIVFVHGTFGSATEISNPAMLFGSNGYCQDRFVAVEYNSLGGRPDQQLQELVDEVLEATGFDQVDLMGHSQGTAHACTYLENSADKVARYVNLSGSCAGNGVPTLSLSSMNDLGGGPRHATGDNVTEVTLNEEDHVAIAGSKLAFVEMYKYLIGEEPEYTTVQCGASQITLSGKTVTFGDNEPVPNSTIDIFEIDALLDTPHERGEPMMTVVTDAEGNFNFQVERGVEYETRLTSEDGEILGYGYSGPQKRSNYLARFLAESSNVLVVAASTDNLVRSPDHVVLVGRYTAGAFRHDWGNSLKVDGQEMLTAENASHDASVVGLFMYDDNENGESDFGSVFASGFVLGTDVYLDATTPRFMKVEWTNEEGSTTRLRVPNWPSSESLTSLRLPY